MSSLRNNKLAVARFDLSGGIDGIAQYLEQAEPLWGETPKVKATDHDEGRALFTDDPEVMESLAGHRSKTVRLALTRNPNTSAAVLNRLCKSKVKEIREGAQRHPNHQQD